MNKKRILVLLSGQLRHFSDKNYEILLKNLKDYHVEFFIACWEQERDDLKKLFSNIYNPIKLICLKNQNFSAKAKNILVPDTAVKSENVFHMWHSFSKGCKEIEKFPFKNYPDYILRYRSDILPELNQHLNISEFKKKNILIPDRYHWNGVNDQFFIFRYKEIKYFSNIDVFLKDYKNKRLLFSSELIFQRFLKKNNFKINYIDYDYKIMRRHKKNSTNKEEFKNIKVCLYDKFSIKLNKLQFKIRNFKSFFIKKKKRNNQQDIII